MSPEKKPIIQKDGKPLADLPSKPIEIQTLARDMAGQLIQDPAILPDFLQFSQDQELSARARNDNTSLGRIYDFLSRVRKNIDEFDWSTSRNIELSIPAAQGILLSLPPVDKKPKKPTRQGEIAEAIARGYINTRFEDPQSPDWRGALKSSRRLLEAACEPEADLQLLSTYFNLIIRRYPQVVGPTSVARRIRYVGNRAIDPADEQYMCMSFEIGSCLDVVSELLGEREPFKAVSRSKDLAAQYDVSASILADRKDPRHGIGKDMYRSTLKAARKNKLYEGVDLSALAYAPIPGDILDIAGARLKYPNFARQLDEFLNQSYSSQQERTTIFIRHTIPLNADGAYAFPYNLFHRRLPLRQKVGDLLDTATKRKALREIVEYEVGQKEGEWDIVPFSLQGMQGYVVLKDSPLTTTTAAEDVRFINDLIEENHIKDVWNSRKAKDDSNLASYFIELPGMIFCLAKEGYSPKSPLQSFLDLRMSDTMRTKAISTLKNIQDLRRDIPQKFTRMPTKSGDKYELSEHPDLPGTIESVVVRKRTGGGLEYEIQFCTDPIVFPGGDKQTTQGVVSFEFNRVNIIFDDKAPEIATDQKWILEHVLLRLVERSCCPPLQEVEEEVASIERDHPIARQSIPGHVSHVGGYRPSGERKQFTQYADQNFGQIIKDLYGETSGVSLATINEKHRQNDPSDDRYLTYNKGRDMEEIQEPALRTPPENLLPLTT